jgi:hypothetical protein
MQNDFSKSAWMRKMTVLEKLGENFVSSPGIYQRLRPIWHHLASAKSIAPNNI